MVISVDSCRCVTHPDPLSDTECRRLIALKSAEEADAFVRNHSKPVISRNDSDLSKMRVVTIPSFFRPATGAMIYDTRMVEAHLSRRAEKTDEYEFSFAGLVKDIDVTIYGGITVAAAEAAAAFGIPLFTDIAEVLVSINSAVVEAGSVLGTVIGVITSGAIVEAQAEPLALQARVLHVAQEVPVQQRADVRVFVPAEGRGHGSPRHPLGTPEERKEELERRFSGIGHDVGLSRDVGELMRFMMRTTASGKGDREPLAVVVVEGPYSQNSLHGRELRYVRGLPNQLVLQGETVVSIGTIKEISPGVSRIESPESLFGTRPQMPLAKALREMGALNIFNTNSGTVEFLYPVPVRTAGHLRAVLSPNSPMRYVVVKSYRDGTARVEMRAGISSRKGDGGLLHSLMFSPETGERLIAAGEVRSENGKILMNGLSPEYPTARRDVLGEYVGDLAPKGERGLEPALNMFNVQRDPFWNL